MGEKVSVVTDPEGKKLVLIHDIRFKSRRKVQWNEVENYLKEYIGSHYEIATNRMEYQDYENKHGKKAQKGWYRYDTRFGIPLYNEDEELTGYSIFVTRMLVRCDEDGKLYLYDFVRTKKETSKPHE